MRFSKSFLAVGADIDEHGHVNNVVYLRWVQEIALSHWEAVATAEMQAKYTWFVLRHEIDYRDRTFEGDTVIAETYVSTEGRVKCNRFTEIKRGENMIVRAKSVWCLLDKATLRPRRVTEEILAVF